MTMLYRYMTTIETRRSIDSMTDQELIAEVRRLAMSERRATVDVIRALMQLDERRLYLGEGCSSLFTYCTQVLHFSEHAAYGRIEAARAARRFPVILEMLASGELTLTAVNLLSAQLTPENHASVLDAARHKSKREIELIVATLRPRPDVPSSVKKLPPPPPVASRPQIAPAGLALSSTAEPPVPETVPVQRAMPPVVTPLAPERYKLQVTISREAHDHLRRAQDLLRHAIPSGDPAAVVERALALLVQELERRKLAFVGRPRTALESRRDSRHVPAAVKREVWRRDGGQCAFVGAAGRCAERGFLEVHHVIPFADGGATDAANLQLRCRAHNAYEAEQWFGPLVVRELSTAYEATRSGPGRVSHHAGPPPSCSRFCVPDLTEPK
jgi:hypothetical protein